MAVWRACRLVSVEALSPASNRIETLSTTAKRTARMSVPLGSKRACSNDIGKDVVRRFAVEGNIGESLSHDYDCRPFQVIRIS